MTNYTSSRGIVSILGFTVLLIAASLDVVYKYFGFRGITGFSLVYFLAVFAGYKFVIRKFVARITEKQAYILTILTLIVVIAVVAYMYPRVDSGIYGGGSDADDALILAANELIHGRYPFYPLTYLGNPIAPMPGSVIFAVPFVLLGIFSMQNVFWLAVSFGVAKWHLKSGAYALALLWTILFFCPAVLQNLVSGIDRMSNAIYVLTAMWLMVTTVPYPHTTAWKKILVAIFLGVGLASRSNFVFLLPLLFSILAQNAGWKNTLKYMAIAGFTCILVVIPFWLYDPAGFTPFNVQSEKVTQFESILPHARVIVPLSMMLLASALSFRKMKPDCIVFFWNCAIVQLFSVLLLSALSSIYSGKLDLYFGHVSYGVFFIFFAGFAAWTALKQGEDALATT